MEEIKRVGGGARWGIYVVDVGAERLRAHRGWGLPGYCILWPPWTHGEGDFRFGSGQV